MTTSAEPPRYLFVYGTLRRGSAGPLAPWLARSASLVDTGSVGAHLYDLGAFPGAVPTADGARVHGELHALRSPARALALLDRYEGCGPDDPPPHAFVRAVAEVERADGDRARAWIYWYVGPRSGRPEIRSGDWLARSLPGGSEPARALG